MVDIGTNLRAVQERIEAAAGRAGRDPAEVSLLAVCKRVDDARIAAAIAAGVTRLGESRVQEADEKIPRIRGEVEWHFIGPLQRNKATLAGRIFDTIHSVTRPALVGRLAVAAGQADGPLAIYVQVEPSGEEPGRAPRQAVGDLCRQVHANTSLQLAGLMVMAPYDPDPEAARPYFRNLRRLRDALRGDDPTLPDLGLSMGMSGDFEVAIEEGATIVRVGTAIFGARDA